nr:LysM peptidoglycan-binding domain-containing protein [Lachnospiraceae bacterium]
MIEVVKEGKYPKNIRQVGQVSGNQKVYLEDYVITYLKQIPSPEESMRVIILYGKKEMMGDELCWFVNGAVGAEKDFFMEKTVIDQESWQKVNDMAGRFFPELSVLGWAIVTNESTKDIEDQILRTQKQFFRSDQKLYFEYNTEEKEENVYLYEKGKMKLQSGYYIYYERNECMQNYMVSLRAAERHPEEYEADRAAHRFREVAGEKRQEIQKRRSATLMTCVSLVLMMVIMVIGITMLNNYEKMQSMEQVLYQISGKIDSNTQEEYMSMENPGSDEVIVTAADMQSEAEEEVTSESEEAGVQEPVAQTEQEEVVSDSEVQEEDLEEEQTDTEEAPEEIQEDVQTIAQQQTTYVIQKGDTLAKICMQFYGNLSDMDKICEMNNIEDKDNILYGQKILLP